MERIDIQLVDEDSFNWYIANEIVPDKYKGKFIISHYGKSVNIDDGGITINVKYFDANNGYFSVSVSDILRIKRKIKILSLSQYNNNFTFDEKVKLNDLYFKRISDIIKKKSQS
jgi:hypothetical protein